MSLEKTNLLTVGETKEPRRMVQRGRKSRAHPQHAKEHVGKDAKGPIENHGAGADQADHTGETSVV